MTSSPSLSRDLGALVRPFYPTAADLGLFELIAAEDLPPNDRTLLAHHDHMTVAMEAYHESLVDVEVLDTHITPTHYSRKILLRRQSDSQIVQFGVMRVAFEFLDTTVRSAIESEQIPLGRILMEQNVLRSVSLQALWRIIPSQEVCELLTVPADSPLYGRTAVIHVANEPAVEVLEIAVHVPPSQ